MPRLNTTRLVYLVQCPILLAIVYLNYLQCFVLLIAVLKLNTLVLADCIQHHSYLFIVIDLRLSATKMRQRQGR